MGFVVFVVMGLYLLISIGVVKGAIAYAREKGKGTKRWGWGAALVMYLIPFWDWIPTVAMHQYYCATEAGFWVYKTPEQWMKENREALNSLRWNDVPDYTNLPDGTRRATLNERIIGDVSIHRLALTSTYLQREKFVDMQSGEVMAQRISVGSGYGNLGVSGRDWRALKFWLSLDPCIPEADRFNNYFNQIQQLGAKK
ncbi:MAG TPA: hypothetical protein PLX65_13940 [Accumulibacter sp.]|nr:hypothetical protein [Accumulibacter sp.]